VKGPLFFKGFIMMELDVNVKEPLEYLRFTDVQIQDIFRRIQNAFEGFCWNFQRIKEVKEEIELVDEDIFWVIQDSSVYGLVLENRKKVEEVRAKIESVKEAIWRNRKDWGRRKGKVCSFVRYPSEKRGKLIN
jgi:hypothetical protein